MSKRKEIAEIEMKLKDGYRIYRGSEQLDSRDVDLKKELGFIVDDEYRAIWIKTGNKPDITILILLVVLMLCSLSVAIAIVIKFPVILQNSESPLVWVTLCAICLVLFTILKTIPRFFK